MHPRQYTVAALGTFALITASASGQNEPVNGMRPAEVRAHAIVDATVVVRPGQTLEHANIIIRDGVIEAVGDVNVPPDARVWNGAGMTVYPGLIDAALMIAPGEREASPGAHWNPMVFPELAMIDQPLPAADLRKELRGMGFTVAAVYASQGVMRGTGAVIALAEQDDNALSYLDRTAMAMSFDRARAFGRGGYPGSLMGAIALTRQTLYDAQWHEASRRVYELYPEGNEPPIRADALDALQLAINRFQKVLFEVDDELDLLRANRVADEFNLDAMILGSGMEFRRLAEVTATGLPLIVPLNYPEAPDVASVTRADTVSLRDMQTWEQAPTNARRLVNAGATIALTTHRLQRRGDFAANLRSAIRHGLSEDDALAALTTTPAKLLGLDRVLGTIEVGKSANLVVVEGSLFDKDSTVRDTWVDGRRSEINRIPEFKVKGEFAFFTNRGHFRQATVDTEKKSITLTLDDDKPLKATKVTTEKERVNFLLDGKALGVEGIVRLSGVITGDTIAGTGVMPDGDRFQFTMEPDTDADDAPGAPGAGAAVAAADVPAGEQVARAGEAPAQAGGDEAAEGEKTEADEDKDFEMPAETLAFPLGAYGVEAAPQKQNVYVHNATIWTEGPAGIIQGGCLIVADGKIAYVGAEPAGGAPEGYLVIDAEGRHVTPGLLDCHSHTGIDGGVNEGSQAVTAEVRIGDVVGPDDINWYRQLAGGLTCVNQLHGSANPIGGQNSVVKLKWGATVDEMRIPDAIAGIKFALGENPKRSTGRYPDTRMGVETVIRDAFQAARDYQTEWDRYLALPSEARDRVMPPRRDLELDTLVEILRGDRLVHCHSYRQDEILMLIRVADEYGFTIGTFQHVLEGYKVADAISRHGAGASTFSDWWAYKIEVMDAIPFNGALMTDVGVAVSFNSDSSELARRMNTEAAKAVRYGGMDPHEALKFVTINPAKQLRIDHRLGSLEKGKDADFVVWSGDPLSTYSRCEQTWIEGARYFDLRLDEMLRKQANEERQRLIQKILARADRSVGAPGGGGRGGAGGPAGRGRRPGFPPTGPTPDRAGHDAQLTVEGGAR